jgi:Tol biopolymer transport system component
MAGALLLLAALAAPLVGPSRIGAATTSITTPLSSTSGSPGSKTSYSFRPWISGDGRYVAFDSDSASLVPGDTNRVRDVFVYDRDNGTLERVSQGTGGKQANGDSQRPTLSAEGRYVAFWSAADNLIDNDTNTETDCFVHDRRTHETFRVDRGPDDAQANGDCARPAISGDGKLVAFESAATNLEKPGVLNKSTDTNKARDVFLRDIEGGTTTRISVTSDGKQGTGESVRPSISSDGRYIAFQSDAPLQADDTNKKTDVYLHDRGSGETTRVSIGPGGVEGGGGSFSPTMSADGMLIAYWSNASNLVADDTNKAGDVFVFDRSDGSTVRISVGAGDVQSDGMSSDPSMSPDGRYVAFWSGATNLVADDTNAKRDIFLFDRETGTITRVSVADDGTQADGDSFSPNIGAGGGLVAFDSTARTLVPDDPKTKGSDVFLHSEDAPQSNAASTGQPAQPSEPSAPRADRPDPPANESDPPPANQSDPPQSESSPPADNSEPPADNAGPPADNAAPPADNAAPPPDNAAPPADDSRPPPEQKSRRGRR